MVFEVSTYSEMKAAIDSVCERLADENFSEDAVFNCKLIACELLSNVIQHGGERAHFSVTCQPHEIVLSVKGKNGFCPPEQSVCSDPSTTYGRGLYLVDRLCVRREYSPEQGIIVIIR